MNLVTEHYLLEEREECRIVHLVSADGMNRMTTARVRALTGLLLNLTDKAFHTAATCPIVICGNAKFFSAGADLNEIAALAAADTLDFAKMGQHLMELIDDFPAPVYAAISGYCMGGGLDLALACDVRICAENAVFAHRGAALGMITGWSGTQRLTSLIGRGRALQMFTAAEKIGAASALEIGLVAEIAADPLARVMDLLRHVAPGTRR